MFNTKKHIAGLIIILAVALSGANAWSTSINDNSQYGDTGLYVLFNKYFNTNYTSGDQILKKYGAEFTSFEVEENGSLTILGDATKSSTGFGHQMYLSDGDERTLLWQYNQSNAYNESMNLSVNPLTIDTPGLYTFELDVTRNGQVLYILSSDYGVNDPDNNYPNLTGGNPTPNKFVYDKDYDFSIHMYALDVTDLWKTKYNETVDGFVYMLVWEDSLKAGFQQGSSNWWYDGDFNDTYFFVNVIGGGGMASFSSDDTPEVPEPGSILLLGTGIIGLGLAARRRMGKK